MGRNIKLSRREIALVLEDLHRRRRYYNSRVNAIIFRLSCCCGLRRKEISGLELRDVITEGEQPCITIRWQITKGGERRITKPDGSIEIKRKKPRYVPLSLDTGTLEAFRAWKSYQQERGVTRFVSDRHGNPLSVEAISKRWRTAIRCLGKERRKQVSCHDGRRTFASVLMAAGAPTVNIKDMLGHESIQTTDNYLCAMEFAAQDLFGGA